MEVGAPTKAPVHLWIVGIVSLLWNAFGALDYTMSQMRNPDWLAMFTESMLAYLESFPAWANAAWAFGVWGALLGSLLLLIRSRYAYWSFAVSLAGLFAATIYQNIISPAPADMTTPGMIAMNVGIWAIAIALLVYSYRMQAKGVLK